MKLAEEMKGRIVCVFDEHRRTESFTMNLPPHDQICKELEKIATVGFPARPALKLFNRS